MISNPFAFSSKNNLKKQRRIKNSFKPTLKDVENNF